MKKSVVIIFLLTILTMCFLFTTPVQAQNETVLDNETNTQLGQMLEESKKDLEYYKDKYGSDTYGMTAYVLHLISIYSIPFCFLGIALGGTIYTFLLSKYMVKICVVVFGTIVRFFGKIFRFMLSPFIKMGKKMIAFIRKWLNLLEIYYSLI